MAPPDRPAPPSFSAAAIEAVCRVLGEDVKGSQIANLIAPLKVSETPAQATDTKWKRLFHAVVRAQNRQQDGRPLIRLTCEVMDPVRFGSPGEHQASRALLNQPLAHYGLEVREDGKVRRAPVARTVSEAQERADWLRSELARRGVHPDVLAFCRTELLQHNCFHAVLEAMKSVSQKIRGLSGVQGDGNELFDAVFSTSKGLPVLAFNTLKTETERSEHKGLATLCKGMFSTYRNTTAHAPKVLWAVERQEALDMLTLASMLHRRLDKAVPGSSL
jgi:uncharacterized protein (TIGR02391 family)